MKTYYIKYILIIISCMFIYSCKDNEMTNPSGSEPLGVTLTPNEQRMVAKNNDFTINFFTALYEEDKNTENIVVSPFSLSMALAMVWNGAEGETKQEIQQTMGLGNYPEKEVNAYFKKLYDLLLNADSDTKIAIANSIWAHKDFPVKQSFYDVNKTWYNAETHELDFSSPDATNIINKWCADNTNNLIKEIITEISPDAVMFLINALYFNGIWKYEFDEKQTQKQTFYKEDGTTVMADMMSQTCTSGYYKDEHLELTTLNYGEGIFSMVFVLPNPNATFDAVLNQLAKPDYFENGIREALQPYFEVDLFIPKFKIEYEKTLNEILKEMNMNLAFNGLADFSNISDIGVHISTVFQKAYIDVNEKGTEAAAVTSVAIVTTSGAPSTPKVIFRADRPFLFAIRENSTGTILFMGKVGNPVN